MNYTEIGKYLSYVLRHNPKDIGLELEERGYVDVEALIIGVNHHYHIDTFNLEQLEQIVAEDNKQRYSFNEDKTKIRANQGHSIHIDLGLSPVEPPDILYHRTADRFLAKIQKMGIKKMTRDFVHLSPDEETAIKVGLRHGKPVVLLVDARRIYQDGIHFYQADNGVWLTNNVKPQYFKVIDKEYDCGLEDDLDINK